MSAPNMQRSSGFDFVDRTVVVTPDIHPDLPPTTLQRNKSERLRLQGLMRTDTLTSVTPSRREKAGDIITRWQAWMVNEGGRRLSFGVFIFLHIIVAVLGTMHYGLKNNLSGARKIFGATYGRFLHNKLTLESSPDDTCHAYLVIARAAALILHIDVIFILLPICRNFISLLRQTPLNDIIPFDKNITFHKSVAWSIVVFTAIHVGAHMVNFTLLAIAKAPSRNIGRVIFEFLLINFTTGPGVTGWIMTVSLGLMVWFAMEKRRRRPNGGFEWFYYVHYIGMIIFFVNWQLHGMFCMISTCRFMLCSNLPAL